jgi:hypothetical protein
MQAAGISWSQRLGDLLAGLWSELVKSFV